MGAFGQIVKTLDRLLFPTVCPGCGELTDEEVLCPGCYEKWLCEKQSICPVCSQPASKCTCTLKPEGTLYRIPLMRLSDYTPDTVTSGIVYRLKQLRSPRLCAFIASEFARDFVGRGVHRDSLITYAPRSARAKSEYGHDQAYELAKAYAAQRATGTVRLFGRSGMSGAQKMLSGEKRRANAQESFVLLPKAKEQFYGRNVIIIDDVATTGATLAYCASLLLSGGAKSVICMTVGRNIPAGGESEDPDAYGNV